MNIKARLASVVMQLFARLEGYSFNVAYLAWWIMLGDQPITPCDVDKMKGSFCDQKRCSYNGFIIGALPVARL